ncbi:MAG: Transcriptional regulator, ArsR family [uncultured Caballeronia sp.]|nr:MAG: Transcriptional regulator, ArsR family [uncultured Caballeronia sp.]
MTQLCAKGWLRRLKNSRAVQVTPKGWAGLKEQFGVDERCVGVSRAGYDVLWNGHCCAGYG